MGAMENAFGARFARAIAAFDAANAADPNRVVADGVPRAKELVHAELLTRWVERLVPRPSEALLLAARAHHIRRWEHPRSAYPEGRGGYLRWRSALSVFHADTAAAILRDCGYDDETINRVHRLIAKRAHDAEGQALEDGLCLVFLETQLGDVRGRLPGPKMLDILRKTWRKMSPAAREAALALPLPAGDRDLILQALDAAGTPVGVPAEDAE